VDLGRVPLGSLRTTDDAPLYPLNRRWSPDGSQILFYNYDSQRHVKAYVTSSQGGTPRPVLAEDSKGQSHRRTEPISKL
jgi:Tol biopolymer transport system component